MAETPRASPDFLCPKVMLFIQMEYCDCDLRLWLDQRAKEETLPFEMSEANIFRDILKGVAYIHAKRIIHRDLKPLNIFFSVREDVLKIGDFGLATLSPNNQHFGNISTQLSSGLGTLPYAAPEQRNNHDYNTNVDMYSVGVILIELLQRFTTRMELYHTIEAIACRREIPQEILSSRYVFLVENLIQKDPNSRMCAKEILNLSLLQGKGVEVDVKDRLLERLERKVEELVKIIDLQKIDIQELTRQVPHQ